MIHLLKLNIIKNLMGLMLLFIMTVGAQTKCRTRVLYSSSDLNTANYENMMVKNVRHAFWSDSIVVKTDKQKITLAPEKVWGMQDDDCTIYRNYEGEFYKMRAADSMVIYSQTHGGYKGAYVTHYYFIRNLDSPILNLSWKQIKKEYEDKPCFLAAVDKEIKWYQEYDVMDKKTGVFKIMEIYKNCLGK